jgi:uncharacterized protein DUF1840
VLVKFRSNAGDITMFGDVAQTLLKMMGQSGGLPGALVANDVPAALERLKRAAAVSPAPDPADAESGDAEGKVSLKQRAFPLVELLGRCAQKKCDVIWEEDRPMFPGKR